MHLDTIAKFSRMHGNTHIRKKARSGSSVGCACARYSAISGGRRFDPLVRQYYLLETGHEIISKASLLLQLIQVW